MQPLAPSSGWLHFSSCTAVCSGQCHLSMNATIVCLPKPLCHCLSQEADSVTWDPAGMPWLSSS